jgi:hypothetical protein
VTVGHLGLFETKRKHDGKVEVEISDVRDTILSALAAPRSRWPRSGRRSRR